MNAGRLFLIVFSLMLNIALYAGIFYSYKRLRHKEGNGYFAVVTAAVLVLLCAYYVYSIMTRRMVYTWDYGNYYRIQLRLGSYFDSGVLPGIRSVAASCLFDDYNCFICLFCAAPFEIFGVGSVNAYIIVYFFMCLVPAVIAYSILVRQLMGLFSLKHVRLFYVCAMAAFALMPLLNYSALLGQPDVFGLVFIYMIMSVAVSYRFDRPDARVYIFLFINTISLMLTRRWYMYWAAAFFVMYLCVCVAGQTKGARKNVFRNAAIFAAGSLIIGGALLSPMFRRILTYDYGGRYSFYNMGGIPYEAVNQLGYIGALFASLAIAGTVS